MVYHRIQAVPVSPLHLAFIPPSRFVAHEPESLQLSHVPRTKANENLPALIKAGYFTSVTAVGLFFYSSTF